MMSRIYTPLIVIILIVLQGVSLNFIPVSFVESGWVIVCHSVFMFLVLYKLFFDLEETNYAIVWAAFAGIIIDIVYTDIIGVYMFSYTIMIFFVHGGRRWLQSNFYISTLLALVSVSMADFILYFIYYLIDITQMEISDYAYYRLFPTVLLNIIIFLIFYVLFKNKLVKWSNERFDLKGTTN